MKILFVSNLYPPNAVGGYERLCADVAAAFASRGHTITVLTSTYGKTVARHQSQTVHQALQLLIGDGIYSPFHGTAARRDAINISNATALRRVLSDVAPDVIYCWNLYGLDSSLLDSISQSGIPSVLMLTDNWLLGLKAPEFLGHYFQEKVLPLVVEGGSGCAPSLNASEIFGKKAGSKFSLPKLPYHVIFGSGYMQRLYSEGGLEFSHATVVHNGVKQLRPDGASFRRRENLINGNVFHILFAGRIVDIKGVHTAIEALALLNQNAGASNLKFHLSIIGDAIDSAYLDRLNSLALRLGCEGMMEFLPAVFESELFDTFQKYDAYIFPSLYEPFSLTLILALAAGIPTVASEIGGNVEIVEHEKTGLLFKGADAADLACQMQRLASDAQLRVKLSESGKVIAQNFTFEKMIDGMENVVAFARG